MTSAAKIEPHQVPCGVVTWTTDFGLEDACVAPESGLLAGVLEPGRAQVYEVDQERFALSKPSPTFHGRDIFAPLAAVLEGGIDGRRCGPVIPLVDTYAEVAPGSPSALVDSWGHLERAVCDGDAAQSLGLVRGTQVTLRRCR